MRTKVGVIGCGYWGPKLIRNFATMEDVELSWIADLRADRLEAMASLYPQARITRDYQEILRSDVEAVVVATPVSSHYSLAMECLRLQKHILVEKPLAATARQAEEIAEQAEIQGVAAMVGHTFQYNPAVNAVRDIVRSGELGRIYYVNSTRVNLGLLQPDINVIWDLAPHDISILMHVMDARPVSVHAHGEVFIQRERQIHEVAYLTLHFDNGVLANLRVSWLDPVKIRTVTIVGSEKMLVYDDLAEDKVTVYDKGVDIPPYSTTVEEFRLSYRHGPEHNVPVVWSEPLALECRAFIDWIRGGQRACSEAAFGARVVHVLEAAQRSLLNDGRREKVAP